MPIAPLDKFGLPPAGTEVCTVDELADAYAGATAGHRRDLFNGFVEWRRLILAKNLPLQVFVGGSFTTSKERPGDVDVALKVWLPPPTRETLRALKALKELVHPDIAKARYSVDAHLFHDPLQDDETDMEKFLRRLRPEDAQRHGVPWDHVRGIYRVMP